MKLYEISEQYRSIQDMADDEDESMILAIADTMEGIEAEFKDKAAAVVSVAFNIESDLEAIDVQIKRLQDKKKSIINRSDRLRSYLRHNMEATGIDKISCPLFAITLSKPSKLVQIDSESDLPEEFVRTKTVTAPDKIAIAKALKDGEPVLGASLVDGARRLTIK
tara:strand:+ start:242 stop:736 length:495 start_codon:yes stop_codon:yes gene_type:complete